MGKNIKNLLSKIKTKPNENINKKDNFNGINIDKLEEIKAEINKPLEEEKPAVNKKTNENTNKNANKKSATKVENNAPNNIVEPIKKEELPPTKYVKQPKKAKPNKRNQIPKDKPNDMTMEQLLLGYGDEVLDEQKVLGNKKDNYYGYNISDFDLQKTNRSGYNRYGYDKFGFDKKGIHENDTKFDYYGYDVRGYNDKGVDKKGYDIYGFNSEGIHKNGTFLDNSKRSVKFYDEHDKFRTGTLRFDIHGFHYKETEDLMTNLLDNINPGVLEIRWVHGYQQGQILKKLVEEYEHSRIRQKRFEKHNPGITIYEIKTDLEMKHSE